MGFRLLLLKVIANGANMSESGFKVDPSSVNALKDHKQRLTNSMAAKSAREKRRKVMADKKAKRSMASQSNVVSPIEESMGTQIAREKRRKIIAAKKAMRCTTSNAVFSSNAQRSQQTKTKGGKNSWSSGEKLQDDISEALGEKPQAENPPTDVQMNYVDKQSKGEVEPSMKDIEEGILSTLRPLSNMQSSGLARSQDIAANDFGSEVLPLAAKGLQSTSM